MNAATLLKWGSRNAYKLSINKLKVYTQNVLQISAAEVELKKGACAHAQQQKSSNSSSSCRESQRIQRRNSRAILLLRMFAFWNSSNLYFFVLNCSLYFTSNIKWNVHQFSKNIFFLFKYYQIIPKSKGKLKKKLLINSLFI